MILKMVARCFDLRLMLVLGNKKKLYFIGREAYRTTALYPVKKWFSLKFKISIIIEYIISA